MTTDDINTLPYESLPNFSAPTSEADGSTTLPKVTIVSGTNLTTSNYKGFQSYYARLERLARDSSLWTDEDTFPSPESQIVARVVLQQLEAIGYLPSKIVSTADNGVALCFVDKSKYADIESTSTGAILGVLSDGVNRPTVWEAQPSESDIAQAVDRIRQFIGVSPSDKDDTRTTRGALFLSTLAPSVQAM